MIFESPNDSILQEDLEKISKKDLPFERFVNKSVVVSGATGLVGSQLIKTLACINRVHNLGMSIYGIVRNPQKAQSIFGDLLSRSDINILVGNIQDDYSLYIPNDLKVDYLIHGASVTTSQLMIKHPVSTILTSIEGTRQMLDMSRVKNVESCVYLSSMEVYGSFSSDKTTVVTEDMLGYLDLTNVRTNYPESKRMCENLCRAYLSEYSVPIKIARLSQTFGAGILPGENRVFAQFAKSAMEDKDIVLHTLGKSEGNYCYTADTISALITILLNGENGESYNISNEEAHTTIADMAQLVASEFSSNSKVIFDIPETNTFGYASDVRMKLSSAKLQALGWKPSVSLKESYRRMISSMKECEI